MTTPGEEVEPTDLTEPSWTVERPEGFSWSMDDAGRLALNDVVVGSVDGNAVGAVRIALARAFGDHPPEPERPTPEYVSQVWDRRPDDPEPDHG